MTFGGTVSLTHPHNPAGTAQSRQGLLEHADVWTVLDLIVAEFQSDPTSVACFDARLVRRAIELNKQHRARKARLTLEPKSS